MWSLIIKKSILSIWIISSSNFDGDETIKESGEEENQLPIDDPIDEEAVEKTNSEGSTSDSEELAKPSGASFQ